MLKPFSVDFYFIYLPCLRYDHRAEGGVGRQRSNERSQPTKLPCCHLVNLIDIKEYINKNIGIARKEKSHISVKIPAD